MVLFENHAMVDGNKRLGVPVMLVFLALNGIMLTYTQDEYSATGVPPIRKSGTAFPRKVYRLSAKVYRSFFRL